ncbi:GNAT family N-acetyltransferase [Ruminococcus sp. FC2018]|uniref:GNAT family N-acetyltransferase n=1 Tax=Ruminococcus sp. FC2018 TaxID=1410617 RepID=UPI00049041F6|nr:GNAT family N-acetyltransferase [Ruminococcus sp. FC2018]
MNYSISKMTRNEYGLLEDFLYEAIFIPKGIDAPPREIIYRPELQLYINDFGEKKSDIAFTARCEGKIVGAVWVRIMDDYGHIDDETPSFAISLYKQYRGMGIGTALMKTMLGELKKQGYKQASLAVQKENYAVKMYKNVGFCIVDENEEEYIMLCKL